MMLPTKTNAELIQGDIVLVGYMVTYECVKGGLGTWGQTGAINRIQFQSYDLKAFGDTAPGGWMVRAIDPVYMADR